MKKHQSSDTRPLHQSVAEELKIKIGAKSIAIRFTDQRISPYAGSSMFWGWLHPRGFIPLLRQCLPHPASTSNNNLSAVEKALAFVQGILCEARKLTHVAYLRRDPLVPTLLGIRRVASQSTLSRFLAMFSSAGGNLRCFGPLWQWSIDRLPSRPEGYTLDLDSTRLLHEDGHQEGVAPGYTRKGIKPCLHPLLGILAEVRLVAGFWLRPGNASCGNNAVAFVADLLARLPRHLRLRGIRADSGFCLPDLLDCWERLRVPYVVAAQLITPIKNLLRSDLVWTATEAPGVEVSEVLHQCRTWPHPRRLILIRHRVADKKRAGGKMLFDLPGFQFQGLLTSLPDSYPPLAVWRYYNGRADCENVIKELQTGFAIPTLICQKFYATEAALSLAVLTYNLTVLFQRYLGWQTKVTIHSLRYWLFISGGVFSCPQGQTTIKLAVPSKERDWWQRLWEKILSPIPNCHAVENRPVFA
jgi:hypothetical protein